MGMISKLVHGFCFFAGGKFTEAIRACIATADNHNALACRKYLIGYHITGARLFLLSRNCIAK